MKRLFIFALLLFLVACGESDLETFVKTFNVVAEKYSIQSLDEENFGEIEEDETMSWQNLYESVEYMIDAKFEDGKNMSGVYLVIDTDEPYDEMRGDAYEASVTIAESLGLHKDTYIEEFEIAIMSVHHSYEERGHEITFSNLAFDGHASVGMIISYDKH